MKLCVLNRALCGWQVKKAFFALIDNGVRAAPLWDTDTQNVIGLYLYISHTEFLSHCVTAR